MNIEDIINEKVQIAKQSLLLELTNKARMEGDKKWQLYFLNKFKELEVEQVEVEQR